MPASQSRERLLAAAIEHAAGAGIADLSLRELAAAIGTSHRMLIYHFGSREKLLVAIVQKVEETQRAALLSAGVGIEEARRNWRHLSDPSMWPQERLFFELYSYALLGRPGTEGFLDGIVDDWVGPLAEAVVRAGGDPAMARADARLAVAVVRGLLLDLLATGDRQAVDQAYERFLRYAAAVMELDGIPDPSRSPERA